MWVQSLDQEDPLEKEMATYSSILAWQIPWTEEPGGLQSMGSQRVGQDWRDLAHTAHLVSLVNGPLSPHVTLDHKVTHLSINSSLLRVTSKLSRKLVWQTEDNLSFPSLNEVGDNAKIWRINLQLQNTHPVSYQGPRESKKHGFLRGQSWPLFPEEALTFTTLHFTT